MKQNEYIIAFSSFYKAAYAEEVLLEAGITTTLRKLPIEIAKSCSTGLFYKGDAIEKVKKIFEEKDIHVRGIFMVQKTHGEGTKYTIIR